MEIVEQTNQKNEHPLSKSSAFPEKDVFYTPIAVKGVLVPWNESVDGNEHGNFKVLSSSGTEYFLLADQDWKLVCNEFSWKMVRLKGLLNIQNMTVVPDKIISDDPEDLKVKIIPMKTMRKKLRKGLNMVAPVLGFLPMVS